MLPAEAPKRVETDYTDLLYKYTDQNGLKKILSSRTLRFARATEMNDPFDVYIDDLFGMNVDEFLNARGEAIFDALLSDPERLAAVFGGDPAETIKRAERLRDMPDSKRAALRKLVRPLWESDPQFPEVRANMERERDLLAERFRKVGIFCATKTYSNLLMWAHYAESHRGAVLGFRPDLGKDSFLRLIKPVTYSTERPRLAEHPAETILVGSRASIEAARDLNRRMLYTKTAEWFYEQELRLTFPEEIQDDQTATFNTFYGNELEDLYFGYRMSNETRNEMIRLAKDVNPTVRIFVATLAKRKYALEFERLTV